MHNDKVIQIGNGDKPFVPELQFFYAEGLTSCYV